MAMKECPRCKNTHLTKEGLCAYCVWKGDVGPGAELRAMIRKLDDGAMKGSKDEGQN